MTRLLPVARCRPSRSVFMLLLSACGLVQAAVIPVNGLCSLPDAIRAANTDAPVGGCPAGAGADTLQLPVDALIELASGTSGLAVGESLPAITSVLTLDGRGARLRAGANEGLLVIDDSNADLTIRDLELTGNGTVNRDGGLIAVVRGRLTVERSALAAGSAVRGGALMVGPASSGTVVRNTTFSFNDAGTSGGTIVVSGPFRLEASTVRDGYAPSAPGILITQGAPQPVIERSVISGNAVRGELVEFTSNGDIAFEGPGAIGLGGVGFNVIGAANIDTSNALVNITPGATDVLATADGNRPTAFGDIVGPLRGEDPFPGPIIVEPTLVAETAAPVLFYPMIARSPGQNLYVGSLCSGTDLRGTARPQGPACDAGAHEREPGVADVSVQVERIDSASDKVARDGQTSASSTSSRATVTNNGPAETGTRARVRMPPGTTTATATPSAGSCGPLVNGEVACDLGRVEPGQSENINIVTGGVGQRSTLRQPAAQLMGTDVVVTAVIDDVDTDPQPGNNAATTVPSALDQMPDAFAFPDAVEVKPGTTVTSQTVTISGIDGAVPVSVSGGRYRIGNGPFTSVPGLITAGEQLSLENQASKAGATATFTTITVGTGSAMFRVATAGRGVDCSPSAFDFGASFQGLTPDSIAVTDTVTIKAIGRSRCKLRVFGTAGAAMRINGGAFTTTPAIVVNGDRVQLRVMAPKKKGGTGSTRAVLGLKTDAVRASTSTTGN
ncbi:MAG: hypothetical protein NTZ11_18175 [Gammaproteobacteria bacterium]|nr:hypothetical protein [Gammaproteobacteria bacterium]